MNQSAQADRQRQPLPDESASHRRELADFVEALRSGQVDAIFGSGAESKILRLLDAKVVAENERLLKELSQANTELVAEITQRKRAEMELKQTHAQLLQAQKLESIGQLAAGIAHEINTPIQFVADNLRFLSDSFHDLRKLLRTYSGVLSGSNDDTPWEERAGEMRAASEAADLDYRLDDIPKAIQQSLDGVESVAKIVRSMKEFALPGVDEMQLVDLNKAIETTITVARGQWSHVADVVTELDPSLPLVPCLAGGFNQVILNMIINSVHAIAEVVGDGSAGKGSITIHTHPVDGWVEIRISDTGSGIPEEVRSKVFDPFFTTKEVGEGSGQGLAISHAVIVKQLGGSIDLEGQVGGGTMFTIRLPIEPFSAEATGAETREAQQSLR